MYPRKPLESAVHELDGELLEGSGFETEIPATEFEADDSATREGFRQ